MIGQQPGVLSPPYYQQRAAVSVLGCKLHLRSASFAVYPLDRFDKSGAQAGRTGRFPDIAREQKSIVDHSQDLIPIREMHGPEHADLRLHLLQGKPEHYSDRMQGAVDPGMGSIGENAEAALVCVDGKKPGFFFLEHVVVSPVGQEMGAEFGGFGHELDDLLDLRRSNANFIRCAAAFFSPGAAVTVVFQQQKRLDVHVYTASLVMRQTLLLVIF
jgi:hypothetical protein